MEEIYGIIATKDASAVSTYLRTSRRVSFRPSAAGNNVYHMAADLNLINIIRVLDQYGVHGLNDVNHDGDTPLSLRFMSSDTIQALCHCQHIVLEKHTALGESALVQRVREGDVEDSIVLARIMSDGNVSLNHVDQFGETAVFWAAREDHLDVLHELLRLGACPVKCNLLGWTPSDIASFLDHQEVQSILQLCCQVVHQSHIVCPASQLDILPGTERAPLMSPDIQALLRALSSLEQRQVLLRAYSHELAQALRQCRRIPDMRQAYRVWWAFHRLAVRCSDCDHVIQSTFVVCIDCRRWHERCSPCHAESDCVNHEFQVVDCEPLATGLQPIIEQQWFQWLDGLEG